MEEITAIDALIRMKRLREVPSEDFGIVFITCNLSTHKECGQFRKYEHCSIRSAMRSEGLQVHSDHYLYFTDNEYNEPKQCFKKLIRQVRFGNVWYKVEWFK